MSVDALGAVEIVPVVKAAKPVTVTAPAKVALLSWSIVTAVTCVIVVFGVTFIKVFAPLAVAPQASVATPSKDACAYPLAEVVP
jgi:hypothetical protein